jgi:hypothetical protein
MKELVAVACWYIWWERRKIVHEEKVQKPARSAQAIAALALNYYRALKKTPEFTDMDGKNLRKDM